MTSKVLVKLPVVPFQQQRKKPPPEIAPLPSSRNADECSDDDDRFQGYTSGKVTQLEQNIKYLQDQHQTTLVSLHQEVEVLRQRNRDLQFQLVFTKGTNYASSSPSSPEDNGNGFVKAKQGSPANVNVAPLQVELLEKDLQDLRASLSETKTRNICLSETVEKQKQKLELIEKSKEKQKDMGVQVDSFIECREVELQARLDDAEALVKRLRLESDEQRKEIANLKSSGSNSYGNNYNSGQSSGQQRGGGQGQGQGQARSQSSYHSSGRGSAASSEVQSGQEDTYHKFPPLHTQSYWHRGSARPSHNYEPKSGQSDYRRNNRHQQQQHHHQQQQQQVRPEVLEVDDGAGMLPQLHNGGNLCFDASASYPPPFYRQQTHHNGGNYHRDEQQQQQQAGNFRKYRGKKPRKDFNGGQDRRVFQYEQNPTTPPKDHHPQQQQQQQQQQQRVPFVPDSRPAPRRHQS